MTECAINVVFYVKTKSCLNIILFTSQAFLSFSDQELVPELALHFAKNRCRQEIE